MALCELCKGRGEISCPMEYGGGRHPENCPACGGEGMGLFAASFAAIQRAGVVFVPVNEGNLLHIELGIAVLLDRGQVAEELAKIASAAFS